MAKQITINAFTAKSHGIANVLESEVKIAQAFDPLKSKRLSNLRDYLAIWDTGATNSCIYQKVVNECGLKPIGMAQVHTASEETTSNVYVVSIVLRNNVTIPAIRVTEAKLAGNQDVLIGMDVINLGDFAVTNADGKTTFSFQLPSVKEIDFVKEINAQKRNQPIKGVPKVGRNAPCPCGSGLKYKKCHGK